jgi:hypothetical protein
MSEQPTSGQGASGFDREISVRGLAFFVAGLVGLMVVAGVLMWLLSSSLREQRLAADPPLPLLPEARQPYEISGPRLQADPAADLAALRAEEELQLSTWGWADEADGLARVPIERAMEMLVEQRGAMAEEDDS